MHACSDPLSPHYPPHPLNHPTTHYQHPHRQEGSALAPSLPLELVFTPFGGGPRLCIGYRFAQQEVLITLIRLLQRFTFELEPGMVPLRLVHRLTLSPRDGVRCRVVRRA